MRRRTAFVIALLTLTLALAGAGWTWDNHQTVSATPTGFFDGN